MHELNEIYITHYIPMYFVTAKIQTQDAIESQNMQLL